MKTRRGVQKGRMTPIGQIAYCNYRELKIHIPTEEETKERLEELAGLNIPGIKRRDV